MGPFVLLWISQDCFLHPTGTLSQIPHTPSEWQLCHNFGFSLLLLFPTLCYRTRKLLFVCACCALQKLHNVYTDSFFTIFTSLNITQALMLSSNYCQVAAKVKKKLKTIQLCMINKSHLNIQAQRNHFLCCSFHKIGQLWVSHVSILRSYFVVIDLNTRVGDTYYIFQHWIKKIMTNMKQRNIKQ